MKVLYLRISPVLHKRIRDEATWRAKGTGGRPLLSDTARELLAERLDQVDGKATTPRFSHAPRKRK